MLTNVRVVTHSSPSEPSSHAPGPGGEAAPAPARRRRARRLAAPLLLLGTALALGGCDVNSLPTFGAFHGATEQGQDEFKLWFGTAIAGLAVAVVVWGLIFWSVFAYRRRRGNDGIPRQFHNNFRLEVIYTTLPIIIVGVLFYFTVVTENEITNVSSRPAEVVNVLAYRWGWQFSYESGAGKSQGVVVRTSAQPTLLAQPATSKQYPQMVLPKGVTTRIVLRTNDVIHGFYVPEFNFSRYAQSGIFNTFDFTPTTGGVFRGQCTQYCGLYHAEMLFSVRVVSPGQFQQWLSAEQAARA
jgi:cytochrome c oxidase subunit 2